MEQHHKFIHILLVLLMVIYTIQAAIVQNTFKKLDPGKDITGTVGAQFSTRSNIECSIRYVFQVPSRKEGMWILRRFHIKKRKIPNTLNIVMDIKVLKTYCRCLTRGECQGYQYQHKETRLGNCILIENTCSNGQIFEMDNTSTIYTIGMLWKIWVA